MNKKKPLPFRLPKSPLLLPPKKRSAMANNNANNSTTTDQAAANALEEALMLQKEKKEEEERLAKIAKAAEEERNERRRQVKETIVGMFHNKRVDILSIDLVYSELNAMHVLSPSKYDKYGGSRNRFSREELDSIITQLDKNNRVMYLRDCGTIYLI